MVDLVSVGVLLVFFGIAVILLTFLRTEARELGMLYAPTAGIDLRWALDKHGTFALTFTGDVSYTKFIDQLFIDHRVSFLGSTLFEMDFE